MNSLRRGIALAIALPAVAWSQDAAAPPPRPNHPLLRAADEVLSFNESRARDRVREALRGLRERLAAASVDLDGDGKGELVTMPELLGLVPARGSDAGPVATVRWRGAQALDDAMVEVAGYRYRVVMPDVQGKPASTLDSVAPDAAETDGVVLAWPTHPGRSGGVAFAMHVGAEKMVARDALESPAVLDVGVLLRPGSADAPVSAWRPASEFFRRMVGAQVVISLPDARPWHDGPWVERALRVAVDTVRDARGLPRQEALPRVTLVGPERMHNAISMELSPLMKPRTDWGEVPASIPARAVSAMATYFPGERSLLFAPTTLEVIAALAELPPGDMENLARAVLLHEAVHIVDYDTQPLAESRAACANAMAFSCWNAVLEGHAQHVARELAPGLGLGDAVNAMTDLVRDGAADDLGLRGMTAWLATRAFHYIDGEAFIAEVVKSGGEQAAIEALRSPPTRPGWISTPRLWLNRGKSVLPDFDVALAPLSALEWTGGSAISTAFSRPAISTLFADLPEVDPVSVAHGIVDGQSRYAVNGTDDAQMHAVVLVCRDSVAAERYVLASRAFQEELDTQIGPPGFVRATYAPLAPPLAGYAGRRTAGPKDSPAMEGLVRVLQRDRYVVEVSLLVRGQLDDTLVEGVVSAAAEALQRLTGTPK